MQKIKQGDEVVVITGKDKGKQSKVVKVLDDNKVLVSGVNTVKKHQRGNPNLGVPGCFTLMGVWPFEVAVLHPGTVKGRSAACTGVIINASVVLSATAHTARFEIFSFITFLFPFNRSRWFAGDI